MDIWPPLRTSTHALFAWTVYRLFPFLRNTGPGLLAAWNGSRLGLPRYVIDGMLTAQFALSHSWLLAPSTRDRLEAWLPSQLYGCLFCLVTCVSLLFAIELWQTRGWYLGQLQRARSTLVQGAFLASWAGLLYSLNLTGLRWQTGWTPSSAHLLPGRCLPALPGQRPGLSAGAVRPAREGTPAG
jgi:hypothetical protein